ncbi:hypothetical protein [Comamonas sp.]|uniref:hypothetical protein n=1 Tax=Comamonas sp. TaxID=34028 RepID=UPI0025879EE8|nr:hypothetical protein [Comamonas sp.]
MYINTTTQEYPLLPAAIMLRHPSTIFPTPFVPPEPYVRVQPSAPPEHDSATHAPQETAPLLIEGEWVQQWTLVEIEPVAEPVPASISRRQGRLALLTLGLLDETETAIAAIENDIDRREAQIEYEADTWERANPFLAQFWAQLGGTPGSLDDAFRLAVTL